MTGARNVRVSGPRRWSTMRLSVRRLLLTGAALVIMTATAAAQTPMAPQTPTTPPPAVTSPTAPPRSAPPVTAPATTPPVTSAQSQVFGKVLSLDDSVAIALETQPNIKARISDYAAAAFRVDQALAPLLPQLVGSVFVSRDQNAGVQVLGSTQTRTTWTTSLLARVSLSQ